MAVLTHRLWRLLRGRPNQRFKRLFHMAKSGKRNASVTATSTPDGELVYLEDEDCSRIPDWIPENSAPAVDNGVEEHLLPGLPKEVVIDFILVKLPWQTLYVVSSLNRAWRDIFRSGEVHEARVRTGTVESVIVMTHAYPDPSDRIFQGVSLYDPARDAWHLLPPLPRVKGGITSKYECAVVKGKVYVIGGLTIHDAAVGWKAVLMLDLGACRGIWNQCANMKHSRSHFACHVKDDKIYVFGGMDEQDHMLDEAHVYDPATDSWSQVESMGHKRSLHKAICLNESLYLCGGSFWYDAPGSHEMTISREVWRRRRAEDADFMEIYDLSKDLWLTVQNLTKGKSRGSYFVVDQCLYHLTINSLEVYDKHSNSWESFQLESWSHVGGSEVRAAEVVNGAIFALVLERRNNTASAGEVRPLIARHNIVATPYKATWSGSRSNSLTWVKMSCPYDFNWSNCSIHSLML